MKKVLRLLTLCIILSFVFVIFAGCGNTGSSSGTEATAAPQGDTANEPTPANSAPKEVVNLNYAGWGSTNEKTVTQKAIDSFNEKHTDIKVTYMYVPNDYTTKMATLAAANQLPDVFMFYKTTALQWGEQDKLFNIKEFIDKDSEIDESKLIPNALLKISADKIIGTKICEEAFATYYNVDMFKEAGIETPPVTADAAWDWDKFLEVAKRLTIDQKGNNALSPDFDPKQIKQYGVRFNRWMWGLFLDSNEASIVTADKSKMNLTDPAVIESVQKLADLINVYHVAPSVGTEKNLPSAAVSLQTKKVAMDLDGQWVNVDLAAANMNFDVGVLPKMKVPSTVQFGEAIVMASQTKHKEESWQLLKWMINPEESLDIYSSGLWMPTVREWYTNPELLAKWADVKPGHSPGFKTAVVDTVLNYGKNNYGYWLKNAEDIATVIDPAMDDIWYGKKTAAEVFKAIEPNVAAKFKGVYN